MYGRPGDSPINDVIKHGLSAFGEPFDSLIRQIGQHQYGGMVRKDLERICDDYFNARPASDADREAFETDLKELIKRLDYEANR